MDIDKQLGAITAEFWSQIGGTNVQTDIHLPSSGARDALDMPLSLIGASNMNKKISDAPIDENKEMEVENDYNLDDLMTLDYNNNKENGQNSSKYQQTLGDIIEETLSKTNKNTPPKSGRARKNSQRSQQSYNQNAFGSNQNLSNKSNNGKENGGNQDNMSVCEWLESQEKQQTLDREEKALQRKRANNKNKKWTPQELQRLYDLLECFGTDFTTIQQYFDKKTVTQIKNKFHKEEKDNPLKIKELLFCKKESSKRLSIKLENERDFQTIQQYYIDKYLHQNLNNFSSGNDSSNSSTPLSLPSPQSHSQDNINSQKSNIQFNQQRLISSIPACINLPFESLKIVADDIERRLLKERSNTQ